jgi:phosphate transport system substrate-binding protein
MRDSSVTRRGVLAAGAGLAASLGGCISTSATPPGQGNRSGNAKQADEVLKLGGSSTVFPVANRAASYWNGNYPSTDAEYWGPTQYGISTDERLADYWASMYGFEADGDAVPPFSAIVSLGHSGKGLKKLKNGQLSVGNSSAPVEAEFPDMGRNERNKFVDHVVGVDAQPIVVSPAIAEAGVDRLTADQLKAIYTGELTQWSQIDGYSGPDRTIQAVGRAEGSGTDTAFRANLFGDPDTGIPGVDSRKGKNQQVKTLVRNSDNAIGYMALAFVDDTTPAITLSFSGTDYVPGENLADPDYPLSRDLHCYTWQGTSNKEAAFLRMVISEFGQQTFVETAGYSKLTPERRQNQLEALPEPEQ